MGSVLLLSLLVLICFVVAGVSVFVIGVFMLVVGFQCLRLVLQRS